MRDLMKEVNDLKEEACKRNTKEAISYKKQVE